jgi:hypothetical protein
MKKDEIKINLEYAMIMSGDDRYIAVAPHLNIVGFGKSAKEAEDDFDKAVKCFFNFHKKNKNLHAKLINLGWTLIDHKSVAPKNFSVPTELLVNAKIQNTASKAYAAAY